MIARDCRFALPSVFRLDWSRFATEVTRMFPSNPRMIAILALTFGVGLPSANAQKMYWPDVSTGKIQRADLDGSNVEDIVTGLNAPFGVALDAAGGKIYWPVGTLSGKIQPGNWTKPALPAQITVWGYWIRWSPTAWWPRRLWSRYSASS